MQHLMSLAGSWAVKLPVRPLLYAAGAAGTAAGVYYYIKKRGDGERTGATTPTQDPVQTTSVDISSLDPSLMMSDVEGVSIAHTDSSGPEDSLAKAKRRYEQAMETNTQLENKNSYLMSKVNTLQDSVQQLNEELTLTWIRCNEIMREREQEQEAHRILKSQCKEMKETLKQCDELMQVCEREVEAHIILKVSLAEVERKYNQAIESNAKLENEKSDLMSKVDKLQSSVQEISNMLSEMHNKCAEATRNYEIAQGILKFVKSNAEEREKIFNQEKQSLTTSLAEVEREYQEILTTNAELLVEQTNLIADVNTLQDSLHDLEEELSETTRRRNEIMRECEQKNQELRILGTKWNLMNATILKDYEEELKAHGNLKLQYNEKKEQHNDLLKEREREQVSLAEAERKYKEAMESNAQLENEKSDLLSQVNTLRASVQQLKEKLSETCTKRDEIREREQEKEAHSILKLQYNPKTLTHNKQLLMVSLAEAVRKYEEAKESNAKLENEKFNLKYHVHILRGSMQELEEMLLDAEMKYDAIKQEREQEREAHNILKMQYKKMKETLTQCNELLMINSTLSRDKDFETGLEYLEDPTSCTMLEAAWKIKHHGLSRSSNGMLGPGVCMSRSMEKALHYPLNRDAKERLAIMNLKVQVGKVKKSDRQSHPLQMSAAWVPPNCCMVSSSLEEDCTWDPDRIKVLKIYQVLRCTDDNLLCTIV